MRQCTEWEEYTVSRQVSESHRQWACRHYTVCNNQNNACCEDTVMKGATNVTKCTRDANEIKMFNMSEYTEREREWTQWSGWDSCLVSLLEFTRDSHVLTYEVIFCDRLVCTRCDRCVSMRSISSHVTRWLMLCLKVKLLSESVSFDYALNTRRHVCECLRCIGRHRALQRSYYCLYRKRSSLSHTHQTYIVSSRTIRFLSSIHLPCVCVKMHVHSGALCTTRASCFTFKLHWDDVNNPSDINGNPWASFFRFRSKLIHCYYFFSCPHSTGFSFFHFLPLL